MERFTTKDQNMVQNVSPTLDTKQQLLQKARPVFERGVACVGRTFLPCQ